jgi:type I restriction enzyme M protein
VPLVIATTDEITKCFHVNFEQTLTRDGEEVRELFSEEEALKFIKQPRLITKEDKVIVDRKGLIKIFGDANNLLRESGLRKDERFSEFANILFLKIISEMEEIKEKPIVEENHL